MLLQEELLVRMNYSQVAARYEIAISQNIRDFCSRLSSFYSVSLIVECTR